MLSISNLTYRLGPRLLLDQATLSLPDGARAGLVGRNGSGKTTLFRIIGNELATESGQISLPRNARSALRVEDAERAARMVKGAAGKHLKYRRPDEKVRDR